MPHHLSSTTSRLFCAVLFLSLILGLAAREPAEASPGEPLVLSPGGGALHEHLEHLDRRFRGWLRQAERRAGGEAQAAELAAEVVEARRHLELLERRLRGLGDTEAAALDGRLRALDERLDRLEQVLGAEPEDGAVEKRPAPRPAERVPSAGAKMGGPVNDACADALPIGNGVFVGETTQASPDGIASCGFSSLSPDVWFRYSSPVSATVFLDTAGSSYDTVLSVHEGCPGREANELSCNDDAGGLQGALSFAADAGVEYLVRVSGFAGSAGLYQLEASFGGSISGRVTDAATGEPLPFVEVEANREGASFFSSHRATTGLDGRYTIGGLEDGSYSVFVEDADIYLPELYGGIHCPGGDCQDGNGVLVEVELGVAATGVDFALDLGGLISGVVRDAETGEPIEDAEVEIWSREGSRVAFRLTGPAGTYVARALFPGRYYAAAAGTSLHVGQLYDGLPCSGSFSIDCDPTTGTPIDVGLGSRRTGVDFHLAQRVFGSLSGRVTDAATGEPLAFVDVHAEPQDTFTFSSGMTDENGFYRIDGLEAGSYFIHTSNQDDYRNEVFDDVPCGTSCPATQGQSVLVAAGATVGGIDFALDRYGAIEGRLTEDGTGAPIIDACVEMLDAAGSFIQFACTDSAGRYRVGGLEGGSYRLVTDTLAYLDELYDDIPCPRGGCDPAAGTPVQVEMGRATAGIDFSLRRLGRISGKITDAATGAGLAGRVEVHDSQGSFVTSTDADDLGRYEARDLLPGSYLVECSADSYVTERYDGIPCPNGDCDALTGTTVEVEISAITENVDCALERGGIVRGRVTDSRTGDGLAASVGVYRADGTLAGSDSAFGSGEYEVQDLSPGSYFVLADLDFDDQVAPQLYDGIECPGGLPDGCDLSDGTPIEIGVGTIVEGLDFAFTPSAVAAGGGSISGRIFDLLTGEAIGDGFPQTEIVVWRSDGQRVASVLVFSEGRYRVEGLTPGAYFLAVDAVSPYLSELYDDVPCPLLRCEPTAGTPVVVVEDEDVKGIDFGLEWAGMITGTVLREPVGAPVDFADVEIWSAGGERLGAAETDDFGRYVFEGLGDGLYFATTETFGGYEDERYGGQPCPGGAPEGCDPTTGTAIEVRTGEVTTGIDFELRPLFTSTCESSDTALCLQRRFRVKVDWESFEGARGSGRVEQLTSDSGYVYFFDPDNVEVVVKVLDACFGDTHRFWVFAAGLTNLGVEMTVTDTLFGTARTYANPTGRVFEPILDTGAFDTCGELPAARRSARSRGPEPAPVVAEKVGDCDASPERLCLGGDRFQVEATWRDFEGNEGEGQADPLTDDTGTFWFFDDTNVELVVKVLDACGLEPFDSFWVFTAGLTNLDVTLTVTDTVSGEVREYASPLGEPFRTVLDTGAFETCR